MDKYTEEQLQPLTMWNYFWLEILFAIPVIGFIFLIVFSISKSNINRRNFARSHFCLAIITIIIVVVVICTGKLNTLLYYLALD